jgi:quercetin dioxygenase-like cupin family protein
MRRTVVRGVGLVGLAVAVVTATSPTGLGADAVGERPLLDNDKVALIEYTFPAGFKGDEHAAFANELAYVLSGEFTVTTQGRGPRVVRRGEVEYASKGTIHTSSNDGKTPAVVLVVILK